MVLNRRDRSIGHHYFFEIADYLQAGDVLVFNDTKVIPARLIGQRESGGKVEILLLHRLNPDVWQALVRPAKRIKVGTRIEISNSHGNQVVGETVEVKEAGVRTISFSDEKLLPRLGAVPLPPYIHTPLADPERYQTVYASVDGSSAAPTAGLHFTQELLEKIRGKGVRFLFVTLHIGMDTFRPVQEDNPMEHRIHREYGVLSQEVASELSEAKAEGRRIICVGTTSVRLVESAAQTGDPLRLQPFSGWVNLFILPGFRYRVTDTLITNFHLPRSTLLMLVSAFAGRDFILQAYQEAIAQRYRFYSFGDCMLIL
jgi:S-adenosylmethionine:tRNA ribosyltransferase-isomerase